MQIKIGKWVAGRAGEGAPAHQWEGKGEKRWGVAIIMLGLYYIIGDVLKIKIRFNYLIIISYLQYMKECQHFTQEQKNRGFPTALKDSMQELRNCEESLIQSLEMALYINK